MKTQAIDVKPVSRSRSTRQTSSAKRPTQPLDAPNDGTLTLSITCGHCLQQYEAKGDEHGPFPGQHECGNCTLDHCKTHKRGEHGKAHQ